MHKLGVDPHSHPQHQQQVPWKADDPVSFTPKCPIIEAIEERQWDAAALHQEKGPTLVRDSSQVV